MNVAVLERDEAMGVRENVQRARAATGLSQEQVAQRAGLTVSTLRKLEQGRVPDPRLSTLRALARALGVTLNDLGAEDAEKPPGAARGRPKTV